MIHHSIHYDDYLRYLILRGKQKAKKLKHTRKQSPPPPPLFQWSEQKMSLPVKFDCVAESVER